MPQAEAKRYYSAPALEKGLDILELFASSPEGFNVSEVARHLDRSVSEIFRMFLCLEKRGYLTQSPNKDRYTLTLRLFRLAQEHPPTRRMATEALPIMHAVVHKLRHSCHLGILDGSQVVIVAQADSPESTGFYIKVGSRIDLMHSATGHAILTHLAPDARERAIQEWMRKTKKRKPSGLESHLSRIRKRGYERRASHEVKGIVNISFPVFDALGDTVAGLTIPCFRRIEDTLHIDKVVAACRQASRQISEALGAEPTKVKAPSKSGPQP